MAGFLSKVMPARHGEVAESAGAATSSDAATRARATSTVVIGFTGSTVEVPRLRRTRLAPSAGRAQVGGMRLLVLGGTQFLSQAVAADAVARGHDVTCAARGTSGPVPDGARLVVLDRDAPDWSALQGEWDAVVDVARTPSWVAGALDALADRIPHWTFVSTISVYADQATPGGSPDTLPLLDPDHRGRRADRPETYGASKVACEQDVRRRAKEWLVVRPGLIFGRATRAAGSATGPSGSPRAATCWLRSPPTAAPRRSTYATWRRGSSPARSSTSPGCTTPPGRSSDSATSSTRSSLRWAARPRWSGRRRTSCWSGT